MFQYLRCFASLLSAVVLAVVIPAAAGAQIERSGQAPNGSYYHIMVPLGWQPSDGLVIWNHGFSLSPIDPEPDLGPLALLHLTEGYAVAASSYSLSGWAVFQTVEDNRQLLEAFASEFGEPEQILIYGASLGGIVTARDIEQGNLGNVVGAYPICGAMAGSRLWNAALDLRLIYDVVCGDVPGAAIPGGAEGLPFPPDPDFDDDALVSAVNACTGVALQPSARSPEQQANLDRLLAVTGLPESFLLTDMGFVTFALSDLVHGPQKLNGAMGLTNAEVVYGDPAIDADIERVQAAPAAQRRLAANYTPTGKVGDVKIVALHTDQDGLVLVENERDYAAVVPPGNLTVGIVVEDTPSHCGFTPAEVLAGWEALRGWVAGQPQPTPESLQDTCEGLNAGALALGPCRIDPDFVVSDVEDRVRPRASCRPDADTLCLNGGRFRLEVSWVDFQSNTGSGHSIPLSPDTGAFWFFDSDNYELVIKVLDGRQHNGRFWVFYGSLTNVAFELTVTDTLTGLQKLYQNPSENFASVGDTAAF